MITKTQKTTKDKKQGGKHKGGTCRPDILERVKDILKK